MKIRILVSLAATALLLVPGLAHAQDRYAKGLHGGASFLGGIPAGEFGNELDEMFGVGVHLVYRTGNDGNIGVRFDADWLLYGAEDGNVTLISPLGGFEVVELTTNHNAVFIGIGPEFSIGLRGARPYAGGSIGLAYFVTNAVADWDEDHVSFTTRVQYDDAALAYAGYAGVLIPITRGDWGELSADFGVRYQGSGEVSFVDEDRLTVNLGTIVLDPVTRNTSLWTLRAGISIAIRDHD